MLVLCSNGLSSEALIAEMQKHTGAARTAALVVTADNEYKEKNYHVPRCREELERLGLSVDIADIDVQPPAELLRYDVVEFIGGNPFYLMDAIRKSEAESVLRQLAGQRLLIGWSAAALVFGPTLALAQLYTPEMNTVGLSDLLALALTQTEVLPHYGKFLRRFERFEERCAAYEKAHSTAVVRLDDGDGLFVSREGQWLVRGRHEKMRIPAK